MSFANFVIDHWSFISPILKGVVAGFLAFKGLNALSNTIGKVKQLTEVFQGVKGVTGIVGKIQKLSGTFKGLGGIAKLVASPFAKWALIIGIVVAGIILIYKNADKIKAAFSKLGDWIIAKVQPAVDWLNGAADWVGEKSGGRQSSF